MGLDRAERIFDLDTESVELGRNQFQIGEMVLIGFVGETVNSQDFEQKLAAEVDELDDSSSDPERRQRIHSSQGQSCWLLPCSMMGVKFGRHYS
jgi:hypothetical protein